MLLNYYILCTDLGTQTRTHTQDVLLLKIIAILNYVDELVDIR